MSDLKNKIKKYMRGDYETIEDLEVEEKKKNISKCIVSFKEKLNTAKKALSDAKDVVKEKENTIQCLKESKNETDSLKEIIENDKINKIVESFDDEILKIQLFKEESDIKESFERIQNITEDMYSALTEEGYIEEPNAPIDTSDEPSIEPSAFEEEVKNLNEEAEDNTHDAIPGVEATTAGKEQKPEEYNDVLEDDPRLPENQHEEVVQGEEITSAYEEGFNRGRQLWEKGINPKNIATQLAETEYAEKPYNYVTRFQEGLIAGCKFQEEVTRDVQPEVFDNDLEEK